MNNDVFIRLGVDDAGVPQPVQRTNAAVASIGKTAEVSARQTAAAMRQLPAQFTDVATQLAGGANPLLVLLQQGGQIKDSFGGVGNAIRGVGAAISPVTLAVGGLAVGVGALALAALQGQKETEGLRDVIALSGNAAGLTGARFQATAEQVAAASQQTVGSAKGIVTQLAATGQVTSGVLASTALAVARVADVSGEDSKKVAADFATMANGVAKWAAEHNRAWNFITVEQYKYIRQLEEQGKAEQAMEYVNLQVVQRLKDQQKNLGFLESAWGSVREVASDAWDAMLGVGREQTTRQQLDIAISRLDALGSNLTPKAREAAEQRIQYLKELVKLENQQADARSRAAAVNRQAIADEQKAEGRKPAARVDKGKPYIPSKPEIYDRYDAMVARAAYEAEEARVQSFFDAQLRAADERDEKRLAQNDRYLDALLGANERAAIELIADERQRGEALIALDREIARRRIEASDMTPDQRDRALGAIDEQARIQQLRLRQQIRTTADENGEAIYSSTYSAFAAAFQDTEGKPLKAFGKALEREIAGRAAAGLATALTQLTVGVNGQGGGLGYLMSLFKYSGTSADVSAANYENSFDMMNSPAQLATGTNYVPRDMLAQIHEGEAVVPKKFNPYADGGGKALGGVNVTQNLSVHVDARADQAEVARSMVEIARRGNEQLMAELRSRGVVN